MLLEKALVVQAAVNEEEARRPRRVPTIILQGIIDSGPQDSYAANGMVATSSDDFHRASYSVACQWADVRNMRRITPTLRSTTCSEKLLGEDDCLSSSGVM